jgi:hypothetical protein
VEKEGRMVELELVKQAIGFLNLQIRELVPESQAYMDLLAFERKLDQTIARKRMEIQEAIKKPLTVYTTPSSPKLFSFLDLFSRDELGLEQYSHRELSTSRAHTHFSVL